MKLYQEYEGNKFMFDISKIKLGAREVVYAETEFSNGMLLTIDVSSLGNDYDTTKILSGNFLAKYVTKIAKERGILND